jgi:predicted nucleic acid-binding protein
MSGEQPRQGMLDTSILILRRRIDPAELPDEMAISAITLAELSAGPHEVRSNDAQDAYDERAERARRLATCLREDNRPSSSTVVRAADSGCSTPHHTIVS